MGFCNGNEGKWINFINQVFHLFHFIPRDYAVDNLHFLLAIIAHAVHECDPSAQISRDLFGNFIRFRSHHEKSFPCKASFTNDINNDGVNQDKEEGVGRNSEVLKDDQNSCQDDGIHNQHEASHRKRRVFIKNTSDDIGSSCSSSSIEDDP